MKLNCIALVLLALPTFAFAESAKHPSKGTFEGGSAERLLSSEPHAISHEKREPKKCAFGEELISDGTCLRINEQVRPMRPDRRN